MLEDWNEIKVKYQNVDVLIGNGFSVNINECFNYKSLFKSFLDDIVEQEEKKIFKSFETSNFELIMNELQITKVVNDKFGINNNKINNAINQLKDGLLTSLLKNHPDNYQIESSLLDNLSIQFDYFSNIFTTNYDLYLYQIIMKIRDRFHGIDDSKCFGDHFKKLDNKLIYDGERSDLSKSIYYLHGSLFIFRNIESKILKLKKSTEYLSYIGEIKENIEFGNIPVIITEGKSDDKILAIRRNYYLYHCLEKLSKSGNSLLIYGLSLSTQDQHIIDAIKDNRNRKIIYSIYQKNKTDEQIESNINKMKSIFPGFKIEFVNSETVFDFRNNFEITNDIIADDLKKTFSNILGVMDKNFS